MALPLILVVDDDAPILLLMRNVLREFGFEPIVANSGPKALEEARARKPDLILLDRHMPGMNGDEVLRELRKDGPLASVPVVILSGEPIEPDELHTLGATGAVLKPFDLTVLVETIRKHL